MLEHLVESVFYACFLSRLFYLCSKEVCVPNVETNRQMYSELNKTTPCFRFWEAEKPDSVLNSNLQAVTDAVGYS